MTNHDERVGTTVTHRRYVDFTHAHYSGGLVDGAFVLSLFGDAATDLCIGLDRDEGLFAGYARVDFHAPVRAGDMIEVQAVVTRVGNRSREISFEASVVSRSRPDVSASAAEVIHPSVMAVSANGTVVVPSVGAST